MKAATWRVADPGPLDGAAAERPSTVETGDADQVAVDEARAGDADAFATLVARYHRRVVNYAAAMMRNTGDAEDAAQETFIRAYRALPRFRGDSSFRTWLYRIATNVARTQLDRRGRRAPMSAHSLDERDAAADVPAPAVDAETHVVRRELIDRALADLSPDLRVAVVLRDVEGLDYQEIADITGAPMGTVESRIFRARRKLRILLAPLATTRPGRAGRTGKDNDP